MDTCCISLTGALPGKEYVIKSVGDNRMDINTLRGYGIFPGSTVKLLFRSPAKNPCAYEIMGAVLALRDEDSASIMIASRSE